IPLIHFVSDKEKMGKFAIGIWTKVGAWISATIIVVLNAKLLLNEISSLIENSGQNRWLVFITVIPVVFGAGLLLFYIIIQPFVAKRKYRLKGPHKEYLPLDFGLQEKFKRIAITVDFSSHDQQTISQSLTSGGKEASYFLIHVVESAG